MQFRRWCLRWLGVLVRYLREQEERSYDALLRETEREVFVFATDGMEYCEVERPNVPLHQIIDGKSLHERKFRRWCREEMLDEFIAAI